MTTTPKTRITTGADFLLALRTCHQGRDICLVCEKSCAKIDLSLLVYSFEDCDCPLVEFTHKTERLWHRACFVAANAEVGLRKKETPAR